MTHLRLFALSSLVLVGCQDTIDLDPLDNTAPVEASVRPAPILGGTLTLTDDNLAIAADPDRDLIHVVDLDASEVLHIIALASGDQPHRVVLGSKGLAHVVLRGAGGIATIDPVAGTVTARHSLCPEPRGLAFHDVDSSLYVACASGSLFHLTEAGEVLERKELEPDLRDVVIVDGEVKVSLFRSAAIVGLDGSRITIPDFNDSTPHVAWRTWVTKTGELAMLHQMESNESIVINPEELPDDRSPYGGGGDHCRFGLVNAAITIIAQGQVVMTTPLVDSNLTVDAAFSPSDPWVAMAVPGVIRPEDRVQKSDKGGDDVDFSAEIVRNSLRVIPTGDDGCSSLIDSEQDYGQVSAVAFTATGRLVLQSREPARLMVTEGGGGGVLETIALAGEPRFDTGHEIFHRATDSGLSCASCHPEGTDDGHVWKFDGIGPRRTQALDVGLADTAPYHWDGDMPDFDVLMDEVLANRMGGKRQSSARADSFTRWLFAQQGPSSRAPALDPLAGGEPELAAAGEALFAAYECTKCHNGPAFGGQKSERISGVDKQVPTLRRVALHPPYMHDGRSLTLEAAIRDMITSTRSTIASDADVAAIAAYLRTL